jgi:hypothetical protein
VREGEGRGVRKNKNNKKNSSVIQIIARGADKIGKDILSIQK